MLSPEVKHKRIGEIGTMCLGLGPQNNGLMNNINGSRRPRDQIATQPDEGKDDVVRNRDTDQQ